MQSENKQLGSFIFLLQSEDAKRKSTEKRVQEELSRCSESEMPGTSESSIFQVEQRSKEKSREPEIKVLGLTDQHEIIEQRKECPKVEAVQVNKKFSVSQVIVEETLQ